MKAPRIRRAALPRVPEKAEQQHIVDALRTIGAAVYPIGRPGLRARACPRCRSLVPVDPGTRQGKGIPDLLVFLPGRYRAATEAVEAQPHQLWIEVKAAGGRLRPEQADFREHAQRAGVAHVVGGLNEVLAYLVARGYMKAEAVPHYRRAPQAPAGGTDAAHD